MTDYQRDKAYECSEWWRVPLLWSFWPAVLVVAAITGC